MSIEQTITSAWNRNSRWLVFLIPFSWLFSGLSALRRCYLQRKFQGRSYCAPVIVVGNISVGGSGKTPVAITLCRFLSGIGKNPCVLTRGFGGNEKGPVFVDTGFHTSSDVGDEPLMMANSISVCVSRNRPKGAAFISTEKHLDCKIRH